MLAQRLRRWPNIKTLLFQRVVFAGKMSWSDIDELTDQLTTCSANGTLQNKIKLNLTNLGFNILS